MKLHSVLIHSTLALLLLGGCASTGKASAKTGTKSLYARVGGLPAIKALIHGSVKRISRDSRVNEFFKGIDLDTLSEHFIQLACVGTGGPCKYEGKGMKEVHEDLHITNAAFDAVLEDIAFTLRDLKVHTAEQDEVLGLMNSMRKDVVELR